MYLAEGPPSHIWLQTLRVVREKSNFCIWCINDKKKKKSIKKTTNETRCKKLQTPGIKQNKMR